ncbi:hypothetical protein SELMODRAFT_418530 [Selaginella moellendorffii]|uniref:Uncharacterized protein n=1 Tax=Selaginella moellendorffii TaxID=88036 RepID=D8S604_SELML|nr:hypothetical protein SELMODRAFT_418530 [Selaginella moellendorffii]
MVFPILTSTSPNSQVDLLLSFCQQLKFSSVVLVGHDDSGLLALMAAANILTTLSSTQVVIKGHFLLTNLLLDKMKETAKESVCQSLLRCAYRLESSSHTLMTKPWFNLSSVAHIASYSSGIQFSHLNDKTWFNLSSVAHIASYSGGIQFSHLNDKTWYSYSQSKLANFFHTKELAIRFKAEGVDITANAVHPGFIMTPLMAMRFKVEMATAKRTIRRTPPQYLFFIKQITNVRVHSI